MPDGRQFELGDVVRDTVTGYEGTITGICRYLQGSDTAMVERLLADGSLKAPWIELARLVAVPEAEVDTDEGEEDDEDF